MASEAPAEGNRGVHAEIPSGHRAFFIGEAAPVRFAFAGVAVLALLRLVLGATLPLSFDEAYYWLWSKHLALSYFDHPPAIAYAIRLGTFFFGATSIGVRIVPLLASYLASWAVWRTAWLVLGDAQKALFAALYFNLTLMVAVETMAATPDALALCASALVVWTLAELQASGSGRWWLAVGAFGGLCLLSKYTGFFLGAGVLFWLVATPEGRRWIPTPLPYLGGIIALALFAPVIIWNAEHDWISFKFQFGRVAAGGWSARYVLEFLLAQLLLASPFILVLGSAGFARASRFGKTAAPASLLAALLWPALIYFVIHALHDRVQGNWPSFLFPPFAILAVFAVTQEWRNGFAKLLVAVSQILAVPIAAAMLLATYTQAFFEIVPVRDPIKRLTAVGFAPVRNVIGDVEQSEHARAILTTSYATTAWLAFYMKGSIPIVQLNEEYRWLSAPRADPKMFSGPLIYVVLHPKIRKAEPLPDVVQRFGQRRLLMSVDRRWHGVRIEQYDIYEVSGWRGGPVGRAP